MEDLFDLEDDQFYNDEPISPRRPQSAASLRRQSHRMPGRATERAAEFHSLNRQQNEGSGDRRLPTFGVDNSGHAAPDIEKLRCLVREDTQRLLADGIQHIEQDIKELLDKQTLIILKGSPEGSPADPPRQDIKPSFFCDDIISFDGAAGTRPHTRSHGSKESPKAGCPEESPKAAHPDGLRPEVSSSASVRPGGLMFLTGSSCSTGLTRVDSGGFVSRVARGRNLYWQGPPAAPGSGLIGELVCSIRYQVLCALLVGANFALALYSTNFEIKHVAESKGRGVLVAEVFFLFWFQVELLLNLFAFRNRLFRLAALWVVLDWLIVAVSWLKVARGVGLNISWLRVVHVLRVFRAIHSPHDSELAMELRLLTEGTLNSAAVLLWCALGAFFTLLLFSVLFVQLLTQRLVDGGRLADIHASALLGYFGSIELSVRTLFAATIDGYTWTALYDILEPLGVLAIASLLIFIAFFTIAVWHFVGAVLLEKFVRLAQPEMIARQLERRRRELVRTPSIYDLLGCLTADGSRRVSLTEFKKLLESSDCESLLERSGIYPREARTFFEIVAQSLGPNAIVDAAELVHGCILMKDAVSGIDLQALRCELKMSQIALQEQLKQCLAQVQSLRSELH